MRKELWDRQEANVKHKEFVWKMVFDNKFLLSDNLLIFLKNSDRRKII